MKVLADLLNSICSRPEMLLLALFQRLVQVQKADVKRAEESLNANEACENSKNGQAGQGNVNIGKIVRKFEN